MIGFRVGAGCVAADNDFAVCTLNSSVPRSFSGAVRISCDHTGWMDTSLVLSVVGSPLQLLWSAGGQAPLVDMPSSASLFAAVGQRVAGEREHDRGYSRRQHGDD
jgi:hypothetical protein